MQHFSAPDHPIAAITAQTLPFGAAEDARLGFDRDLARTLRQARDHYEDRLDFLRGWTLGRKSQIAELLARGTLDPAAAGGLLSSLAESMLAVLVPQAAAELAGTHGRILKGRFAIVAMGKLGSREMTPQSDLDLIFVYDVPDPALESDGMQPLAASAHYAKLGQRLLAALAGATWNDMLFEIDMRLRPFGDSGPIAASLTAFRRYYERDAWTWEHMALTRARVVAGDPDLGKRIDEVIREVLVKPRDPARLVTDVADMRRRISQHHRLPQPWRVKHRAGGLVDIEFIAQYLQLRHAAESPAVLSQSTGEAITRLARQGFLDGQVGQVLTDAVRFWQAVQSTLRALAGAGGEDAANAELYAQALGRVTGLGDPAAQSRIADDVAASVRACYETIVEKPGAEKPAAG